jgi:hypothetical protein
MIYPKRGPRLAARAVCRIGAQRAANIGAAILLLACMASPAGQATPIAIVDFDYTDSWGEVQNQTAKHQAPLQAFMASVRRDLTSGENYRVVALSASRNPARLRIPPSCSARRAAPVRRCCSTEASIR